MISLEDIHMKFLNKYKIVSIALLLVIAVVHFLPFTHTTNIQSVDEKGNLSWAELPNSTKIPGKGFSDWPSEIKRDVSAWKNAEKAREIYKTLATSQDKVSVLTEIRETIKDDYFAEDFVKACDKAIEDAAVNADVFNTKVEVKTSEIGANNTVEEKVEYVNYLDSKVNPAARDYFTFLSVYPLYGEKDISIFTLVWHPAGALEMPLVNALILVPLLFILFGIFAFFVKNYMAKAVVAFLFSLGQIWAFIRILVLNGSGELPSYIYVGILLLVTALATIAVGVWFIPEFFREKEANAKLKKSL